MIKKILFTICCFVACQTYAQYDPGAFNFGITGTKGFGSEKEIAIGGRIEYAYNCYTTYMGEFSRQFAIGGEDDEAFNEFALGVNLILFNWHPTTITGGIGYVGNNSKEFEAIEDEANLAFKTGNFNHGAQVKIRALHQVAIPLHIFAELNLKSLGRRYDTFSIGFSYDFDAVY